ncbi:S46 family peptidase [bacterium]|nr:S46 family peptidase [bacterium]MBU1063776.1 S46 family peptidase [bacterium]MBU1635263.1 S46 family peptidase [bacterium]MBU1873724.1 S46 family peptidase [bacterium]
MRNKYLLVGFCLLFVLNIQAEEGMWLLSQLPDLNLAEEGFQITAEEIYSSGKPSLSDAIVWLGGCSASFVSPDGLILTNHHCAYGALQRNSVKDGVDYITDGFLAENKEKELPAIGQYAFVLNSMADVTDEIINSVKNIKDLTDKEQEIERNITEMEKSAENNRNDRYCYVAAMYNGKQYIKYLFTKYQDVRIVFAPPAAIGKYGGDVDNWMWPRHTGDFTYLRVYQAPDGSGGKCSPENIPVKSPNYLKMAASDLKPDDITFILGFPGGTMRYRSSYSVDWNLNRNYIPSVKRFQEILDIITHLSQENQDAKLKLTSYDSGINNTMKKYQGNIDGMQKSGFIDNKRQFEKDLTEYLNSKRKLKNQFGDVIENIAAQYAILEENFDYDEALKNFGGYTGGVLYNLAAKAYEVARERAKPESERRPEFSEKRVQENIDKIDFAYLRFYEPYEKIMLIRALKQAAKLPEEQWIMELDFILKKSDSVENWVDDAFTKTGLKDVDYVKELYNKSAAEMELLSDPLIDLVVQLYDAKDRVYKQGIAWDAKTKDLRKKYIDALYAWKGQNLYPDANSTLRFTFGKVKGYTPADGIWYKPFTTLTGVVGKDTGEEPFNNPAKLTELSRSGDYGKWIDPELGDVPSCFLCDCDITGGNSGSAVMNAKGELIGLAFDGNYEAMTSDWLYNPELQRTIVVDIRYVLFITEKFADADYLLKEMGI